MIIKLTLSFEGIGVVPDEIIPELRGQYIIAKSYRVGESILIARHNEIANIGVVRLWGPRKFIPSDDLLEDYQRWGRFLHLNEEYINGLKCDRIILFTEIYFDGGQCNFEVADVESLTVFSRLRVALPVSVYCLTSHELEVLAKSENL